MTKLILNLAIFCVLFALYEARATEIQTTVLKGLPDEFNVSPYTRVGDKLYHFGQSKVNWFKASLICRSMGGFLAAFESQDELNKLSAVMVEKYSTDRWWWMSGSDLESEGDFWSFRTGERISFADWSGGQPDNAGGNENCMHLWYSKSINRYQMNDWICTEKAYYICEAEAPKNIILSIFSKSIIVVLKYLV